MVNLPQPIEKFAMKDKQQESEDRYLSLVTAMAEGVVLQDVTGSIITCNANAEKMLGLSADQMVGRTSSDPRWQTIHEDGSPFLGEMLPPMVSLKSGKSCSNVVVGVHKPDGEVAWLSVNSEPMFKAGGEKPYAVVTSFLDITEKKRDQDLLLARLKLMQCANQNKLDDLLTATLDEAEALTGSQIGFYHFLEDDQETLSLRAWSTKTEKEYCKAEGKGQHYNVSHAGVWVDCIHQKKPVIHNDYHALPHKKGLPPGHAVVLRELSVPVIRNGKIMAILGVGNKPNLYTEKDVKVVSTLADLTWDTVARLLSEQALFQSELNNQRWRISSEMSAGISHNLNNILMGIVIPAQILKERINNPDLDELVESICSSAQRASDLVQRLHQATQKIGRTEAFVQICVNKVVQDVVLFTQHQWKETGKAPNASIRVHTNLGNVPPVWGVESELFDCVANLLLNAIEALPNGGDITITTQHVDQEYQISIRDTGIGMSDKTQQRLFDPFFTTQATVGKGLGLKVVQNLVHQRGGAITVESELGKGSCFTICLPIEMPGVQK
jgi:PAS domain S-box-containing protein